MSAVVWRLDGAATAIENDPSCDQLTKAVGVWLRSEAAVQRAMQPMVDLVGMAVMHAGGPQSYVKLGKREDGTLRMHADTNEAALAVADAALARYEISAL